MKDSMSNDDAYKPVFETALDDYNAMVSGATKAPSKPTYYQQPSAAAGGGFSMSGGDDTSGEFSKGFMRSFAEIPGLAAGTGAYLADIVGADNARDALLKYAKESNDAAEQKYGSDNASFTNVLEGKADPVGFLKNASGYVTGQALQFLLTGGIGAGVARGLLKGGSVAAADKLVAAELAKGASEEAAKKAAADFMVNEAKRTGLLGATTAAGAQNFNMELGSIYPDAVEQAQKDNRTLDAGDKLRILGAAGAAAATDTAMERINLGKVMGGSHGDKILGRAAREIPKSAVENAATEGIQTGFERYGAGQNMNDAEAWRDYIDSMAVGAVGGVQAGALASLRKSEIPPHLQPVADKAAEPNSPLSKAAMAGNAGVLGQAAQATQPGADQTQTGNVDPISARVTAVDQQLTGSDTLQKLRELGPQMGAENLTNDFLYALQVARDPRNRPDVRQQAMDQVEQAIEWTKTGFTPATPEQPGTALAVRPNNAVAPADLNGQFFDPNTIDGEAVRVDNMLPGPKALPGPQRALTTQEQPAPAAAPVASPAEQQNVAPANTAPAAPATPTVQQTAAQSGIGGMTEVQAPRVETPAGAGPAVRRKRKAVIDQLVANGFGTVVRDGKDFWMTNQKTGQKFKLDGPADAQMANNAIKLANDAAAHQSPNSPLNDKTPATKAQIDAGNYEKPPAVVNGIKLRYENPKGSTRSGVDENGKPWSVTMQSHYGHDDKVVGADGDKLDFKVGDHPSSPKMFVVDQINPNTGKFDEHKVIAGVRSLDEARRTYLADYEPNWKGLGAITEITKDQYDEWTKSGKVTEPFALGKQAENFTDQEKAESAPLEQAAAAGQQFTYVNDGNGRQKLRIVKPGELQKKASGERTGKFRELTQGEAKTLEQIAAILGRRVVFFEPEGEFKTDGFVRVGDPSTIYVNKKTSINPLAVFGHEFFHTLRETNPQAWEAIAAVVATKVTGAKRFRKDRYGKAIAEQRGDTELSRDNGGELEELVSDLGGNLLKDSKFWKEVFDKINADNGAEAKGIIAKLSAAIQSAITRMVKALNQRGFAADSFVKDLDQVRAAFGDALAQHLKDTDLAGRVKTAPAAEGAVKKSTERPEGLTVEGYHFSKAPRQVLNSAMFGTGLKGSARDEIKQSGDARLKQRISFYVDKGTGITPEAGVGGIAHKATLTNVYDADADPLRLKSGNARDFESKVLDAGYDGYLTRMEGTQPGQVIMLGKRTIKPEVLGPATKIDNAKVVPAPQAREQDLGDRLLANQALPAGELTPARWSEVLMAADPELAAQLLDVGALDGTQAMYKDELAAKARQLSGAIKASAERAKSEYDDIVAKYKDTPEWLKAPNGNATNLSERQWVQVRTPSFKSWFGDWEKHARADNPVGSLWSDENVSKVVDDNGEPMVVYHGTDKGGFMRFIEAGGKDRGDLGIWTTDDLGMAKSYVHKGRARFVEDPEQGEQTGWKYVDNETGEVLFSMDLGDSPETIAVREKTNDATAEPIYGKMPRPGDQPGVYALFANIRNPNESNFEGANWDGMRFDQYQVRDENDEPIYDEDGNAYFDRETADIIAEQNPGSEVQPADTHYETTDEVARDGQKYGNDGSIIRNVTDNGGGYDVQYDELPHDIFVAFTPNQVKSADFNNGEFSANADIRKSTTRKVIPESVDDVTNVDASFQFAGSRVFATNRDFKLELQKRALEAAKAARVKLDERDERTEDYLVRVGEKDARSGLRDNANAVGWYNEKVSKALAILGLIHPELKTNPEARFAFTWALAVTSNGQKVGKNFELAEMVYQIYKDTGRMPTDIKAGQTQGPINESLALFNDLRKAWGMEQLMDFMVTKDTVKNIQNSSGVPISGEGMNTEVYGSAILGPKIGNGFFMNLYGQFDQLTMDRWLMRTWGRWTGTLIEIDRKNINLSRERLTGLIKLLDAKQRKAFEEIIGARLAVSKVDEMAKLIQKASAKPKLRERMNEIGELNPELRDALDEILGEAKKNAKRDSLGGELRKLGNNLAKYLDGQKEAPAGSKERDFIRKVFGRILAQLKSEMPDLTMADLQAVLWYPEKRLYDAAKADEGDIEAGYADDEAPDYANAAADLATQKGVPADKIAQVQKEIDDEIAANKRARDAGRGDRESSEAGPSSAAQTAGGAEARGLPESERIRGSAGRVADEGRPDQGSQRREQDGSLNGLPRDFTVAGKKITASHWAPAEEVARQYMADAGLPYNPPTQYVKVDPQRAMRIAAEYDKLKHDPQNPEVKAAYAALVKETAAQYQAVIDSGLQVEFIDFAKQGDPYAASPRLMTEDVRENNHMWVFSTRDGFGSDVDFDPVNNPLLAETDFIISGQKALVNDLFRVVHDYFGHVKEGVGFRADGEENTWRAHSAMFSPLAQRALTTETRGQNSWVNYGPYGEQNRTAGAADTHYADQKVGLLPEWVSEDGKTDEPTYNQRIQALQDLISCLK
jgi:hypothetical protein